MIQTVLYLGPKGSYSNLALENFKRYFQDDCLYKPTSSILQISKELLLADSDSIAAVVPIENSIEGDVRESQDNLSNLSSKGYKILAETNLNIVHVLAGFGSINDVDEIISHPQALAQCQIYINNHWQDKIRITPTLSTSNAIKKVAECGGKNIAAIGSAYCANLYNVPIIDVCINDEINNSTRFILISKLLPQKDTVNKVSLAFSTYNQVGALNKILTIFEKYNLNLSYINSRPSKQQLGEYVFYVDLMGHANDKNVQTALKEIKYFVIKLEILSEGAVLV